MQYRRVLLWFFMSSSAFGIELEWESKVSLKKLKRKLDLPTKEDLKVVLPVLHDILNFYLDNRSDIDLNLDYGIFLLNVLLKGLYHEKASKLSTTLQYSFRHLLEKNKELLNFFNSQVAHDSNPKDSPIKKVLTLYSNESLWTSQIKKFDVKRTKEKKDVLKPSRKRVKKLKDMQMYEKLCNKAAPTPLQADFCLRALAQNVINVTAPHKCNLPEQCVILMFKSSSAGSALTRRLLLLQFAHFGRRCWIESEEKDAQLELRLCKRAFSETSFLIQNGYQHAEQIFDEITLCALVGHFEFLKHSWLSELAIFRTRDGCFTDQRHHKERKKPKEMFMSKDSWHLNKDINSQLLSGYCKDQVTSGALTTMALAAKYILEAYF